MHSPGEEPRNVVVAALSRLQGRLAAFVRARVPAEDVEDLLQNAAARAAESATSLKSADGLEPWLFRIHRNAITDRLRHRASEVRALQRLAELVGSAISPESSPCACSLKLARDLPQRLAEILVHVDVQGEGVAETAKALGISNNNAAVRLHRARSALRARLREHCGVTTARDCASCVCGERGCCD